MDYVKLSDDKWVEVDLPKNTSRVIVKSELEQVIAALEETIGNGKIVTDEQKIAWFNANYPGSKSQQELSDAQSMLTTFNRVLEKLI